MSSQNGNWFVKPVTTSSICIKNFPARRHRSCTWHRIIILKLYRRWWRAWYFNVARNDNAAMQMSENCSRISHSERQQPNRYYLRYLWVGSVLCNCSIATVRRKLWNSTNIGFSRLRHRSLHLGRIRGNQAKKICEVMQIQDEWVNVTKEIWYAWWYTYLTGDSCRI